MSRRSDDDPREALRLAASSLRLVGGILLLVSAFALIVTLVVSRYSPVRADWLRAVTYAVPGAAFVWVAHYVARSRVWAVALALGITTLLLLGSGLVAGSFFVLASADDESLVLLIPAALCLLFTLAVGTLVFHLTRTIGMIRRIEPAYRQRAFEPIMTNHLPWPGRIDGRRAAD